MTLDALSVESYEIFLLNSRNPNLIRLCWKSAIIFVGGVVNTMIHDLNKYLYFENMDMEISAIKGRIIIVVKFKWYDNNL